MGCRYQPTVKRTLCKRARGSHIHDKIGGEEEEVFDRARAAWNTMCVGVLSSRYTVSQTRGLANPILAEASSLARTCMCVMVGGATPGRLAAATPPSACDGGDWVSPLPVGGGARG